MLHYLMKSIASLMVLSKPMKSTRQQAEVILHAALDPNVAYRAGKGEFVKLFDHFQLLHTVIN